MPPGVVTVTSAVPLPVGIMAVIWVSLSTETIVAAVEPNVTVAPVTKFVPVMLTEVPPDVDPLLGLTLLTVGAGAETAEKVTICMTHGPEVTVAVALLLPVVVTIWSSAISASGWVS